MNSISVVLCTYNRPKNLIEALSSLNDMIVPEGIEWEVLVMDNNSSDDTARKAKAFIGEGRSRFSYHFEPRQGKTYALNQGIEKSTGNIIAFTDDDAVVDAGWLRSIVNTFNQYDPDCVGGKVLPIWLNPRPGWLTEDLLKVLAILDLGDQVFEFDWKTNRRMLFGVNFAFKKEFFVRNGLFETRLGSRGEDQEMFERLGRVGARAVYNPEIIVSHNVFPERLKKSYFRRWYYAGGLMAPYLIDVRSRTLLFGIPRYVVRQLLRSLKGFFGSVVTFDRHAMFLRELELVYFAAFFKRQLGGLLHGHRKGTAE